MKKLFILLLLIPIFCAAQPGYIFTIAGNGSTGFSGDGGPATAAQMRQALGVGVDAMGNVYIPDNDNNRIRKVNPAGIISTVAGGGSSYADGIAATAASIYLAAVGAVAIDAVGNLFFIDGVRIRKVTVATGVITTIAGTTAGLAGDGGPATAAKFSSPHGLCFDAMGNLYVGDEGNARVRKINTSGIITTYAGTTGGLSGDGGPATAAQLRSPDGLCVDMAGNLYVADRYNYRLRKITPAGIISTHAGTVSGFSGDGGPATDARFSELSHVCMDSYGNLYISDFHNARIRKITPSGIISTFAGGGSSSGSGIPATAASLNDTWGIAIDQYNNIYIPDRGNNRVCKVNGLGIPTVIADSFSVATNPLCAGPAITIIPNHYSSLQSVKTWFGDGSVQTDTFSAYSGYSWFNHTYNYPNTYNIKHVLYSGSTAIDSITYSYTYQFCRSMPLRLYYDDNSNCAFDAGSEFYINHPTKVEVDSNGVVIDTLTLLSGMDYNANGYPGDVYTFKILSTVPGLVPFCPSTGIVPDTLTSGINNPKYIGFQCSGTPGFDLTMYATAKAGRHQQEGHVLVSNTYCTPQSGLLTVNFSPRYIFQSAHPWPTSAVGNTITWDLGVLSSIDGSPKNINYMLTVPGTYLIARDTVNSSYTINPTTGDENPGDNNCDRNDTVKSSYDPNIMEVSPAGIIPAGILLTYTTEFENVGNDTAHNIFVLDTLPNTLDIRTFAMVASTHSVMTSKKWNGSNWVLRFDFPKINLLDSSHHNECTGVFVFKIKVNSSLAGGTVIPNRAGIYFDDNEVVMTNSATDVIESITLQNKAITLTEALLYPNPVTNMLYIENMPAAATYRILNILGSTVMQGSLQQGANNISMQALMQGVYLVDLTDEQGNRVVRKVVKE